MDSSIRIKEKIGFIGGGNMARAICDGLVNKGKLMTKMLIPSY